jgi:hypothetical protein
MTPSSTTIFEKSNVTPKWQPVTWENYLSYADASNPDITGLFFNQGYLLVQMGNEVTSSSRVARAERIHRQTR